MEVQIKIKCSTAEQTQIKQNLQTNQGDTVIVYKPIYPKPEDVTAGEYILSLVEWEIEEVT